MQGRPIELKEVEHFTVRMPESAFRFIKAPGPEYPENSGVCSVCHDDVLLLRYEVISEKTAFKTRVGSEDPPRHPPRHPMSYDIWLEADLGAGFVDIRQLDWNYTSNVACMWRAAMPETEGLYGMDNKRAGDMLPILEEGIKKMQDDPEKYIAMNPTNGWGSFEGQLAALEDLANGFRRAPDAIVRISA